MLVVDTSALLEAIVSEVPDPKIQARLGAEADLHAPHLLDLEFIQALRRLSRSGVVSEGAALAAREMFRDLRITRYPHHPLNDRIWELRHNLTAYDAAYVALAEALGATVVTCDARLAGAPLPGVSVELYGTK